MTDNERRTYEYELYEQKMERLNSFRHSGDDAKRKPLDCNVWFIGDTHFYHNNVIEYCNRPFKDVYEMNEQEVQNWNNTVSKKDKVFMVGDFALANKAKIIEIGQRLNGRKTLILGNHDHESKYTYYEAGFEYVSRYPIIFEDFYIISHQPQFIQSNGVYANIFAHVHDNPEYTDCSSRSFCVSAERINYTPIEFNEIIRRMKDNDR